jgi:tetratricopeptide (TPR) repeat protein
VLREAARLAPGSFSAWYNRGNQLLAANGFAAAEAPFRRAVALEPARPEPHNNLALALLTQGQLAEAWPEFDWRWRGDHLRGGRRTDAPPLWHGAPAASTILLAVEQGIGDTLQFCRYAPLVAARGHRVVLEVQPEVLTLVSHSLAAPSVAVAARAADYPGIAGLPAADALCPMMSLPGIFATTLETIPATPYLRAESMPGARCPSLPWRR